MRCPSCSSELVQVTTDSIELDLCRNACGGIWFDGSELEKFDNPKLQVSPSILRVRRNSAVVIDRSRDRSCPRCSGQPLQACIEGGTLGVEVDKCNHCSGVWLDIGELEVIRDDRAKVQAMEEMIERQMQMQKTGFIPKGLKAVLKLLFS